VAVEDPSFPRVLDLLRALGLVLVPAAVDDDGVRPDELERALAGGAKALLLTPRWQNPFGARLTAARTAELRALLDEHPDVLVVDLWADPTVQAGVAETATVYAARRMLMLDALAARGICAHGVSGLNVWIPVAEEAPTVAGMLQRGWAITAGERWRLRSAPAVRITISTLGNDESDAVADDLAAVLERRPGAFAS